MDLNREAAYKILIRIEKNDAYSNLELENTIKGQDGLDRNFISRLVYGVIEYRLYLDYFLDKIMSKGVKGTKLEIVTILRLGMYQMEFMNSVPDYAAINTSVDLAKKYCIGFHGLVNGVLRACSRSRSEFSLPDRDKNYRKYLSIKYSCNPDIINLILCQLGNEKTEKILKRWINPPILAIRVNCLKTTSDDLIAKLKNYGYRADKSKLSPRGIIIEAGDREITALKEYEAGEFSIQSQESIWISDLCNPTKGEKVLDLCAGPGGKTLAIAEKMGGAGEITACDIYKTKLKIIDENAKRLGINTIDIVEMDGTKENMNLSKDYGLVLIDAPCSGLGVISKKPELKYKKINFKELAEIQFKLITNGAKYLKPGGKLVYSTCTINKMENREILDRFIDENPGFRIQREDELGVKDDDYDGFYRALLIKERS